ncbi:MAG TPA: hypothetical protein VHO50_05475 [Bacteroidales bacterium]|nr:hypothetical protein [Bacteroidales bacterium]
MKEKDIIFISAVLVFLGIRLYMKYGKKKDTKDRTVNNSEISKSEDSDYEPYSGK